METWKVKAIEAEGIVFENGDTLFSDHEGDCCEWHWLDFTGLTLKDFENLKFDLSNDDFFKRIENYGIELIPIKGHSIKVPGYGQNNGYYSSELTLVVTVGGIKKIYDISDCQDIDCN